MAAAMSAVLAPALSPIEAARAALDEAMRDLASLDARIHAYVEESDEREIERQRHRVATISAVSAGKPLPKAPKQKPSDANVALPILREQRKALASRVAECEGLVRRAAVEHVERSYQAAQDVFAKASTTLIDAWRELVGTHALYAGSGVRVDPLPQSLASDFAIPVVGRMRPIAENHWAHFVAEHSMQQREDLRAASRARAEVEREIGKLPW